MIPFQNRKENVKMLITSAISYEKHEFNPEKLTN